MKLYRYLVLSFLILSSHGICPQNGDIMMHFLSRLETNSDHCVVTTVCVNRSFEAFVSKLNWISSSNFFKSPTAVGRLMVILSPVSLLTATSCWDFISFGPSSIRMGTP